METGEAPHGTQKWQMVIGSSRGKVEKKRERNGLTYMYKRGCGQRHQEMHLLEKILAFCKPTVDTLTLNISTTQ